MPFEFTNSRGASYHLHRVVQIGESTQRSSYQRRYYWSTERNDNAVVEKLPDGYAVKEGPNAYPCMLFGPFVHGEWTLDNEKLLEIELIQRPGNSWTLPRRSPRLMGATTDGGSPPVLPGEIIYINRPKISIKEDIVTIHFVMQRDAHGTLYYLHAATTDGQRLKIHYWWSPELSSDVVAEPPPDYQVILSAAGQPLLVPRSLLRDDKTLDAAKEAELECAQQPGKSFLLPKPN